MINTSNNIQVQKSREAIANALFSLMKNESYHEITITQICQEAHIARQTFYRNFTLKGDVLTYYFSSRFLEFTQKYPDTENFAQNLSNLFRDFPIPRDILFLLKKQNIFYLLEQNMVDFLEYSQQKYKFKRLLDTPRYDNYLHSFIVSTINSTLSCWIENNFEQDPKELTQIVIQLLSSVN